MTKRRAHGEGSVHLRTRDGRWIAVLDLGFVNGKRLRKTFVAQTETAARKRLKEAQRAVEEGRSLGTPPTVGKFLHEWLAESIDPSTLAEKTKAFYRGTTTRHLIPAIGTIRLDKLTARDIERMLATKRQEGLGDRSVQAMHATLRRALATAVNWGLVLFNVATRVDVPRPVRNVATVHALPREVVLAMVDASGHIRLGAIVPFLLMTGLRKGELLALKWSDLDIDTDTLTVSRSAYRRPGVGMVTKPTKTDRQRTISMPRQCVELLREHRRYQASQRLAIGPLWQDHGLVFTTEAGGYLDEKVPNTVLHRVCKAIGLPPERVHNLRHSAAMTAASASHGDLHLVKNLLGHASISTTLDTYGHRMTESQVRLGEAMSDWFDARPRSEPGDDAAAQP